MLRASVLIPTHEHAATLPFAVASVQAQSIDDIEILIVGDGVDDELRATVKRLQVDDPRIEFFDFPKGPRHGEIHRDVVLRRARGRIVCYQADDDLWLPGHLEDMEAALETADLAGSMAVNVSTEGWIWACFFDIERPEFREPWLAGKTNGFGGWANDGFGLAIVAHRMDAYLRLSEGWTTAPLGVPTDQFMWMKFARESWCRLKALPWPVSLRFPELHRRGWTAQQHAAEQGHWMQILRRPGGREHVYRELLRTLGDTLLRERLTEMAAQERDRAGRAAVEAERDAMRGTVEAERAALEAERCAMHTTLEAERAAMEAERAAMRATLEAERAAIFGSRSWRLTAPLRATAEMLRRLRSSRGA